MLPLPTPDSREMSVIDAEVKPWLQKAFKALASTRSSSNSRFRDTRRAYQGADARVNPAGWPCGGYVRSAYRRRQSRGVRSWTRRKARLKEDGDENPLWAATSSMRDPPERSSRSAVASRDARMA